MAEKKTQFWMVWSSSGKAPTYQHQTLYSAREEAQRLARLNPGHEFIVLTSVTGYAAPEPTLKTIEYDEIPF